MSLFQGFGAAPAATSAPANPFGATPAPAASAPANPFGSFGSTPATSAPATSTGSLFGAAPAASAAATTSSSLFPSLTATTSSAAPAATSAPSFGGSLFSAQPATATSTAPTSTLSTGSLFSNPNSTAAANALTNAATKSTFGASTATAAAVALTPDTIAGSTKYTELPADAKSTLDQFHQFLQSQIHLSATLTSRPSDSLDKISKDTVELSKRLSTLNDALGRDTKVIEALQSKVGQELKQADSAGRIIEAYSNTSQANFLYAGNNSAGQYFLDQCQAFEDQIRQFRSTIEEIERHLASFGSRNPQVAHALPEVLRNQHEGFLSVASRVAVLHDEIRDREKAYLMFRRKFFDDESDPFEAHHQHQQQQKHRRAENGLRGSESQRSVMLESGHLGQSINSGSSQKSFRDIAKETLRPGSAAGASASTTAQAASTAAKPAFGGSLFGGASTTSAAPATSGLFGSTTTTTAAPATGGLFGSTAPVTSTAGSSLFGQPAASTGGFGGFGTTPATSAAAPAATTGAFGGFGQAASAAPTSAPTFSLTAPPAGSAAGGSSLFGAPAATASPFGGGFKLGGK
ncbi:nucleoporin p58/p45 [Entomortierella parvispora]|uniref:Nucleoporin p58/p45 n=1 Tax=Entomortierella parvispora TaxID=205924 RepID=A0A9P3HJN0_9FUNG|nr:nucleoporin p58/p45 [Entomortierella parvispora]